MVALPIVVAPVAKAMATAIVVVEDPEPEPAVVFH
jgi:hypothetical protein